MSRLPLCTAHSEMFLTPAAESRQSEPLLYDAVDVIQHEHLGQHQLAFRAHFEFSNGFVSEAQQLGPRQLLLVLLDPLQDELLIFLPQRGSVASRIIGLEIAQHGTVNLAITG